MTGASTRSRAGVALGSLILVCGAVTGVSLLSPYIEELELKSYDFLVAVLRNPPPPPGDVVIVAIDETSIKEFAEQFTWPWPRGIHGS